MSAPAARKHVANFLAGVAGAGLVAAPVAVVAETADPADVDAAVVDALVRQACSTPSPARPGRSQ